MHPGILIILLFSSLSQHCLIKGAENEDSDALWTVLIDLHSVYCGETGVCRVANQTEPSPDLFPLPCCVPCSCSVTCESNQNYCPSRMRFKPVSDVTTTRSDTTDKRAVMTLERKGLDNKFNTSIEKLHRDSDGLNGDNARHTNNKSNIQHSEALETSKGLRTKIWFDKPVEKTTVSAISAEKQAIERLNKIFDNNDNSSENNVMYHNVQIACLRLQLLYRLNQHPNSDSYEMVISCPKDFNETVIVKKCRAGQSNKNIADVIPITSKLTGLTYVNKCCLLCKEPVLQSKSVVNEWRIHIIWHRLAHFHSVFMRPQSFMNIVNNHFWNVHFSPKNLTAVRKCKLCDVTVCNETGLWENYDYTIEKTCSAGETLPVIHTVDGDRLLFKNIACVLCNILSGITTDSRLNCGLPSDSTPRPRRTLSVNYHCFNGSQAADEEDIYVGYIETATLHYLKSDTCPDGSIKLLVRFFVFLFIGWFSLSFFLSFFLYCTTRSNLTMAGAGMTYKLQKHKRSKDIDKNTTNHSVKTIIKQSEGTGFQAMSLTNPMSTLWISSTHFISKQHLRDGY